MGYNSQIAFWCGLGVKVVTPKRSRLEAINGRFGNIALYFQEVERTNDWYRINKDRPTENLRLRKC